ncbi:hypothetical protein PAAG_01590 [Paracoccidioides lutzii Pb01]|uniref:Uncharacterized protein n=1 Tax=Paracoccidioides lutzii (strain ATCC MYA-826 / Pb01) TaxID=502779 RepID=C1GSU5_PARBA|nr:hypothetical protein PAAG_01590 [Paracoccidioides lutzii Pb01]EEH39128.2 hypothetical protein PAAG_01590 [Paracoccidioides lutzii Pb01]
MEPFKMRQRANTTGDTTSRRTPNNASVFPYSGLQDAVQSSAGNTGSKRNNTANINVGSQRERWKAPPAFDFQLSSEPEQIPSPQFQDFNASDNGTMMIGVALGSPTMHRTQQPGPWCTVSTALPDARSVGVEDKDAEKLKPKATKWKQISGLFKSKNPVPPPDTLIYQVPLNDRSVTSYGGRDSPEDSHIRPNHACQPWDDVDFQNNKLKEAGKVDGSVSKPPKKMKESKKLVKYIDIESLKSSPKKSAQQDKHLPLLSKEISSLPTTSSGAPDLCSPLLTVDIPDIHLERYSVMFSTVLGKPPPSTLLAKRSRTLDMLRTHDEEPELGGGLMPPPKHLTSPLLAKSPTFTLFPATSTSKPSKLPNASNFPVPGKPLQRSNTAPPSPRRVVNEIIVPAKDNPIPTPQARMSSLPTSSSSQSQWAPEGSSFLSTGSASSSTSDDSDSCREDEIIFFNFKHARITTPDDNIWEILNPRVRVELPSTTLKAHGRTLQKEQLEEPDSSNGAVKVKARSHSHKFETKLRPEPEPKTQAKSSTSSQTKSEAKSGSKSSTLQPLHSHPTVDQLAKPPPPPPQRKPPPAPSNPAAAIPPKMVTSLFKQPPPNTRLKSKSLLPHRNAVRHNPPTVAVARTAEISVARSISVAKRTKQQMIVPISAMRSDSLRRDDERFGEKKAVIPKLISVPKGHGRGRSQQAPIEIV